MRKDLTSMQELVTNYSISEIILFVVILSLSLRRVVEFIDWVRKRAKQQVEKSNKPFELEQAIRKGKEQTQQIRQELKELERLINLLVESDKDDIKQSITRWHHHYCYEKGNIDDYSLDCLEKRYSHYKDQGGNSFVKTLMQELRALPRENQKK